MLLMNTRLLNTLLIAAALLVSSAAWSNDVDTILAGSEAPAGVVFEIIGADPDTLDQLLTSVGQDIGKLRQRFPDIPVAVVTHGQEQFALTTDNRSRHAGAHQMVRELVNSRDVDVHVCGTHAEWYGQTPEDYPDYVDVAAAGPAQINDYLALGYELIVLP